MKRINKKNILIFIFLILSVLPVFSADVEGAGTMGVSRLAKVEEVFQRIRIIAFGAIPGLLIATKFVYDIVASYMDDRNGPEKRNKAIINLVITLGILALFVVIIRYILPDSSSSSSQSYSIFRAFFYGAT